MSGVPRKTNFKKTCKYCDSEYITKHKYSHVCDECKIKMRNERFEERKIRSKEKPIRSYWRRLMDGENI